MLQESTRNLKKKLRKDKKKINCQLVNVRNRSCKELFKMFNFLNKESFFKNFEASAWYSDLIQLTEDIQAHLAEKDSIFFLEREKAKSEKKLAVDGLNKISIEPL